MESSLLSCIVKHILQVWLDVGLDVVKIQNLYVKEMEVHKKAEQISPQINNSSFCSKVIQVN